MRPNIIDLENNATEMLKLIKEIKYDAKIVPHDLTFGDIENLQLAISSLSFTMNNKTEANRNSQIISNAINSLWKIREYLTLDDDNESRILRLKEFAKESIKPKEKVHIETVGTEELLIKLENKIKETENIEELIEIATAFEYSQSEILNKEYKYEIFEKIISKKSILQPSDCYVAINTKKEINYFKFHQYYNLFENVFELNETLQKGIQVQGVEFLKSGALPVRNYAYQNTISENDILKIVRGQEIFNSVDEKKAYKKLQLSTQDVEEIKKGNYPIIVT